MSRYVETFAQLADRIKRGGQVELGAAEILVEESLSMPSGLWLRGQGDGSVLLQASPEQEMLVGSGVVDIHLSDFAISGNPAGVLEERPKGLGAIRFGPHVGHGVHRCSARRLSIMWPGVCAIVVSSRSVDVRLSELHIECVGEEGVYMNGLACSLVYSTIRDCAEAAVKSGGKDCIIQGNHLLDNRLFGVLISPKAVGGLTTGNIAIGAGFECFRINDARDHMLTNKYAGQSGRRDPKRVDIRVSGTGHVVAGNVGEVKRG